MIAQLNEIAQIWWQWMGSMFWQVSLFIILITTIDMAIRRWAWPQVRYTLWVLVFLKLVIPPTWQMPTSIVSWIQPRVERQIPIQIKSNVWTVKEIQVSVSGISAQKQDIDPAEGEKPTWQAMAFLTWIAGIIAFAIMLIIKMSRLPKRSQGRDKPNIPEWFRELLVKTSDRLNLKKVPGVVFSTDLKSPAVYGLFQPVLLLPDGYLNELSEKQAEHVLIHELCHLKRGDLLIHWFCLTLQIIYWFNPLLIWTRRQMRHVCEVCCDLSVAEILRERTIAYRDTLLSTARELLTETVEPSLGLLGIFEEPFRLVSRLKWLEKKTWGNNKRKIAATIITSLIMVICVMPMAGISQTNSKNNKSEIQSDDIVNVTGQGTQDKDHAFKPQIFIEAVVAEVDEEAALDLGIELQRAPTGDGMETGSTFGVISDNGITVGGKSFTDIKAGIEAMKTEPGIHILNTPQIMTLDNNKATLKIESPHEWDGDLSLEVSPQIQENGYILQEIGLEVSYQTGEESGGNGTITGNFKDTFTVRDGQTVSIGNIRTPEDAIYDENSSNRKELIMLMTTHIVNTKEESDNIFQGVIRGTDGQQIEDKGSIRVAKNPVSSDPAARRKGSMPDEYIIVVEYESDENSSSTFGSITRYDTLIMVVDADKELDLDAELIGPPLPGSQIEEDDHYTMRLERRGVYPGNQTDEGDHYDIERVEVLRGPQDTPGPTVSIYTEGEIAEPPDLPPVPPDATDKPSVRLYAAVTKPDGTEYSGPANSIRAPSIGFFKDDITIDGESFPDIEAVFESIKTEAGVNILGTPRTITLDDKEIKMSWNMAYDKTSTVALGMRSRVINDGAVEKMVSLSISPPIDEKSKEHTLMTLAASLTQIENGGAMVMIVSPVIEDAKAEQDNTSGKKLYVFLTPHVENP